MNIKKLFGRVCSILTLIFLVQTQYMFGQGDINVVIPEASLTNTVLLLQDAKALNFAKINAVPGVPYFGMYTTSVGIDLKDDSGSPTSETIAISLGVTARAFFNLSGFRFDVVVPFSVTVFGRVTLQQHQGGYKLVANLQGVRNFNLTGTGWIDNYVQDLANGFIQHLPPISLVSETALLPNTIGSYFTSGTPTLKITNDAAILSLTLSNLPRQIIARNNYDGNFNVGQVEVKEGSNFVTYNSPHTYFAPINSIQTLRANQGVTSHNSNQYKYKNWNQQITGREAFSIQSNPFSFQVTSDLVNTADFKQVVPATISNSLEGIATGGSLIVNGISYSGSFNDYLFKEGNGITTNVPNGTLGTDWSFQGWSNGMTTPQINFAPTSATTLIANWKGRLLSSLAEASSQSGSQRRFARDVTAQSVYYLVYESAGKIWLTYTTNSGASWQPERFIEDGTRPSLASSQEGVALSYVVSDSEGNSEVRVRAFSLNPLTGALNEVNSVTNLLPCTMNAVPTTVWLGNDNSPTSDAKPRYAVFYETQGTTQQSTQINGAVIRLSMGSNTAELFTLSNSQVSSANMQLYPASDHAVLPNALGSATISARLVYRQRSGSDGWLRYQPLTFDFSSAYSTTLTQGTAQTLNWIGSGRAEPAGCYPTKPSVEVKNNLTYIAFEVEGKNDVRYTTVNSSHQQGAVTVFSQAGEVLRLPSLHLQPKRNRRHWHSRSPMWA
jgi:hypothetical protein